MITGFVRILRMARRPRHLFIHVGTHKTATTTIQAVIRTNQKMLKSWGVETPRTGATWSDGRIREFHHDLAWELGDNPARRGDCGSFQDLIHEVKAATAPTLILSSEEFSHLPKVRVAPIRSLARPKTVILYLRRHDAFLASCYAEQVARGRPPITFAEWLETPRIGFNADYERLLDVWGSVADRLIVRPFDVRRFKGGDIVEDFFSHLGVPAKVLRRLAPRNARAGAMKDAGYEKSVNLEPYRDVYARIGSSLGLGGPLFDIDEPLESFDPGYGARIDSG